MTTIVLKKGTVATQIAEVLLGPKGKQLCDDKTKIAKLQKQMRDQGYKTPDSTAEAIKIVYCMLLHDVTQGEPFKLISMETWKEAVNIGTLADFAALLASFMPEEEPVLNFESLMNPTCINFAALEKQVAKGELATQRLSDWEAPVGTEPLEPIPEEAIHDDEAVAPPPLPPLAAAAVVETSTDLLGQKRKREPSVDQPAPSKVTANPDLPAERSPSWDGGENKEDLPPPPPAPAPAPAPTAAAAAGGSGGGFRLPVAPKTAPPPASDAKSEREKLLSMSLEEAVDYHVAIEQKQVTEKRKDTREEKKPDIECFKCGKRGHFAAECRSGGDRDRDRGGDRGGECFNCGKLGHKASECRNTKNKKSEGNRDMECFNCGKLGHKASDCRQGSGRDTRGGRKEDEERREFRERNSYRGLMRDGGRGGRDGSAPSGRREQEDRGPRNDVGRGGGGDRREDRRQQNNDRDSRPSGAGRPSGGPRREKLSTADLDAQLENWNK